MQQVGGAALWTDGCFSQHPAVPLSLLPLLNGEQTDDLQILHQPVMKTSSQTSSLWTRGLVLFTFCLSQNFTQWMTVPGTGTPPPFGIKMQQRGGAAHVHESLLSLLPEADHLRFIIHPFARLS